MLRSEVEGRWLYAVAAVVSRSVALSRDLARGNKILEWKILDEVRLPVREVEEESARLGGSFQMRR